MASQYDFGYMEAGQFVAAPGVPKGTIDGIAEDSKGTMWIAHRASGLLRLLPDGSVERTPQLCGIAVAYPLWQSIQRMTACGSACGPVT